MRENNTIFQKKKNIVLFIYGFACQLCGLIDKSNHVHHNNRKNYDHSTHNLVPLCNICHKLIHKSNGFVPLTSDKSILAALNKLDTYF